MSTAAAQIACKGNPMLYSVYCQDKDNTAALREEHLAAHRAHLDLWRDKIFFSGPLQFGSLISFASGRV